MSVYYKHERSENIDIPYTFKCEQCGAGSGPLNAHIVGDKAIYNSNFKTIKEERNQKLCAEAHEKLVSKVKEIYQNATEKDIYSPEFKDVCPHCQARQSWSVSGLKKNLFELPITVFLVGVIITIVALIARYQTNLGYVTMNVIYGIAGASVLAAAGCLVFNIVNLKIRQSKVAATDYGQNKPQIDWKNAEKLFREE
ncbi:MAG: hypothetical protein HFE78_00280 [Clostridiales bacterium]|nr:hypothetical protein [Clostridiales bacterium]